MTGTTIVFICHTCQSWNKQNLGMPGFEWRESEIADSLTMAYEHIKEGHEVHAQVRNYEED